MHKEEAQFNAVTGVLDLGFQAMGLNVPFFILINE